MRTADDDTLMLSLSQSHLSNGEDGKTDSSQQISSAAAASDGVLNGRTARRPAPAAAAGPLLFPVYEHVESEAGQYGVLELGVLVHDDGDDAHVGEEAPRSAHNVLPSQPILN